MSRVENTHSGNVITAWEFTWDRREENCKQSLICFLLFSSGSSSAYLLLSSLVEIKVGVFPHDDAAVVHVHTFGLCVCGRMSCLKKKKKTQQKFYCSFAIQATNTHNRWAIEVWGQQYFMSHSKLSLNHEFTHSCSSLSISVSGNQRRWTTLKISYCKRKDNKNPLKKLSSFPVERSKLAAISNRKVLSFALKMKFFASPSCPQLCSPR